MTLLRKFDSARVAAASLAAQWPENRSTKSSKSKVAPRPVSASGTRKPRPSRSVVRLLAALEYLMERSSLALRVFIHRFPVCLSLTEMRTKNTATRREAKANGTPSAKALLSFEILTFSHACISVRIPQPTEGALWRLEYLKLSARQNKVPGHPTIRNHIFASRSWRKFDILDLLFACSASGRERRCRRLALSNLVEATA